MPNFYLLLQRKWSGLTAAMIVSLALTTGAFLMVGAEATENFFLLLQRMVTKDSDWWNRLRGMHNLRALTVYWLSPASQTYFWWSGCGLIVSLLAWINLRARQRSDTFEACWIANITGLLLVNPHLFTHDLTILILPCALFLTRFTEFVPAPVGIGLIAVAVLPILNPSMPTITAITLLCLFMLHVGATATALRR
jgi:hypothetical protein